MDDMTDTLSMFFERSNAMQSYWSLWITIALALLAFFGTGHRSRLTVWLATWAFVAFAWWSLNGILAVAQQRLEICTQLHQAECKGGRVTVRRPFPVTVKPPSLWSVVAMHLIGDAFVVIAMHTIAAAVAEPMRLASARESSLPS